VLGALAPRAYGTLFGAGEVAVRLATLDDETARQLEQLRATDASDAAISEYTADREMQSLPLRLTIRQIRDQRAAGMATAVVLALVASMIVESLVGPEPRKQGAVVVSPAVGRLVTVRYALVAIWIALVIARPTLLEPVPALLTILLVLVALAVGLVPLGPRRAEAE
jgi:hypothetical protein